MTTKIHFPLLKHTLVFCFVGILGLIAQGQNGDVNNLTAVPVPGVGHDYLSDLNEVINPANGSVSIRVEAPRPKERGFNFPFYSFIYDSTQQFSVSYHQTTNGEQYRCGVDTANDNAVVSMPTQPLNCVLSVQFDYQSINTGSGLGTVLSGPNSSLAQTQTFSRWVESGGIYKTCNAFGGYSYEDPYGVIHDLGVTSLQNSSNTDDCSYLGIGGSPIGGDEQYKVEVSNIYTDISFPATGALTYSGAGNIIDTHGNSVKLGGSNGPVANPPMEDTNGNAINGTGRTGTYQSFQPWGDALASPRTASREFAGGAAYEYTWGTATTSFTPSSQDASYSQDETCGSPILGPYDSNPVVTQMKEPDGLSYVFAYDPKYGLLSSITYPAGATVKYTWGVNSIADATGYETSGFNDPISKPAGSTRNTQCIFRHDTPAIIKRVVSYDGTTPALEQDFSYSTQWMGTTGEDWTSKQTVVKTTDLLSTTNPQPSFTTTYNYTPWPEYISDSHLVSSPMSLEGTIVYKDTHGATLRTITKVWNSYNQLAGECTTLPNGHTSGTFYQYAAYTLPNYVTAQNGAATTTESKTDIAEYDFNLVNTACARPTTTATRETVITYATFSSTPLWPTFSGFYNNQTVSLSMLPMADRPASIIKYQNGTRISETDFTYDSSSLTSVSTPIGHDEHNYTSSSTAARGNPTVIRHKCFTGSIACKDAVWTVSYDSTGQPVSVTDPDQNKTTLSYADNYTSDDGSPSGNTNTYLTKITRPTTGGVAHVESFEWDFDKGQLRTINDENNQVTSFAYNDPWWRLTSSSYPDGGGVTNMYDDSGPQPTSTSTKLQNSTGSTIVTRSTYDASGQLLQSAVTSDPAGTTVDTTYDGLKRLASISNPHGVSKSSSDGITTFAYDSLNRKTIQTQPDGSERMWCYDDIPSSSQSNCSANKSSITTGTWVDSSDEIGVHWQNETDGLGRLVSVMEPLANNPTPTSETDYSYDANDNLVKADQWGGAHGSTGDRVHTFAYDSLSHLLTSANPETGTVCYGTLSGSTCQSGYDNNGNLLSKTDARGTTVTNSYDALNRLVSKLYSDVTPSAFYQYDINTFPGQASTYPIGRLSQKWTSLNPSSTNPQTDPKLVALDLFFYDSLGRVKVFITGEGVYGEQTSGTSYYGGVEELSYDLAGNLSQTLTFENQTSAQRVIDYAYDGGNHLTKVSSDSASIGVNPSLPTTLFESTSYSAVGLTAANLAYTVASSQPAIRFTQTFDNRLRSNSGAFITSTGALKGSGTNLYSYTIPSNGYAPNGNLKAFTDSALGTMSVGYDNLNRIFSANVTTGAYASLNIQWNYDAWGNRLSEIFGGMPSQPLPMSTSASYSTKNQVIATQTAPSGYAYDGAYYSNGNPPTADAGEVTNDGVNQYAYDAEGRVCATLSSITNAYTAYLYDPDGLRLAKASFVPTASGLNASMCSPLEPQFTVTEAYTYSPDGEQIQRFGPDIWENDNIYASGKLLASYSGNKNYYGDQQYYLMGDWLGSTRAQITANADPTYYNYYLNLPFGNGFTPVGPGPDTTDLHYTGKERDQESGLDYFGARYYGSNMGRFMSPDWAAQAQPVPYANLEYPQTLNLYSYAGNNPLSRSDPDGHCDWCQSVKNFLEYNHGVTNANLNSALQGDADAARKNISGYKNMSVNGTTPAGALQGLNNKQVVDLDRSITNFFQSQMMGSGQTQLALAIATGGAEGLEASATAAMEGRASAYLINTARGALAQDVTTNISAAEFGQNLEASGFTKTVAKDGVTSLYTKGEQTYSVYGNSRSTGGPSANLNIGGKIVTKIRLQ